MKDKILRLIMIIICAMLSVSNFIAYFSNHRTLDLVLAIMMIICIAIWVVEYYLEKYDDAGEN